MWSSDEMPSSWRRSVSRRSLVCVEGFRGWWSAARVGGDVGVWDGWSGVGGGRGGWWRGGKCGRLRCVWILHRARSAYRLPRPGRAADHAHRCRAGGRRTGLGLGVRLRDKKQAAWAAAAAMRDKTRRLSAPNPAPPRPRHHAARGTGHIPRPSQGHGWQRTGRRWRAGPRTQTTKEAAPRHTHTHSSTHPVHVPRRDGAQDGVVRLMRQLLLLGGLGHFCCCCGGRPHQNKAKKLAPRVAGVEGARGERPPAFTLPLSGRARTQENTEAPRVAQHQAHTLSPTHARPWTRAHALLASQTKKTKQNHQCLPLAAAARPGRPRTMGRSRAPRRCSSSSRSPSTPWSSSRTPWSS
jgi:hypothetical protein